MIHSRATATITNLPSIPSAQLSTMSPGTWCTLASDPGSVYCVFEQTGAFTELALFSGTQDCVRVNKTNTTLAVAVPSPAVTLVWPAPAPGFPGMPWLPF